VATVFDALLAGLHALLEQTQSELARLDVPALADRYERSLTGLRETLARPLWFKKRKLRLAQLQAANDLAAYARAGHKVLLLRARADVLGRVRPALLALPDRAHLEGAGRELLDEARRSFVPPLASDVAGVPFAAVRRWVEDLFGPVPDPPAQPLGAAPVWHEWDRERFKIALRARAGEDSAAYPSQLDEGGEVCRPVADASQLTALGRLSHPLVLIPCWAYDAHPQHVFQRWLIPAGDQDRWRAAPLPEGEAAFPCGIPWPTAVTVYRDLPVAALADGPGRS
jgi:hypothetical protein